MGIDSDESIFGVSLPMPKTELQTAESQTADAVFFETVPGKPRLATLSRPASAENEENALPGLFWLGGFRSNMRGLKGTFIDAMAERQGRAFTRFDYSGHGESEGDLRKARSASGRRKLLRFFARSPQARKS